MAKIKRVNIRGLRGVRKELSLDFGGKSALLYGDNGSGKSTIADVMEWFIHDKVDFLVGEEIGRKGYEALRNIFISDEDESYISLMFSDNSIDNKKSLSLKKKSLITENSNASADFTDYIEQSTKENLILRYRDLVAFVMSGKTDKLKTLSQIIGYSKVTATRDILRKVFNRLDKEIKTKNFENQISNQQSQIVEQFSENITNDSQFIDKVNGIIKPFNLDVSMSELKDINVVLKKIKTPDNKDDIDQETYLLLVVEKLVDLPVNFDELDDQYNSYKSKFESIASDVDKLKKLTIEKLLVTGKALISGDGYNENTCPLCLQEKDRIELIKDVDNRIIELEGIKKEQKELENLHGELKFQIHEVTQLVRAISDNKLIDKADNLRLKKYISALKKRIDKIQLQLNIKITDDVRLIEISTLSANRKSIEIIKSKVQAQVKLKQESRAKDTKADAYGKIKIAGHAYSQIKKLEKERDAYEVQRDTMEVVVAGFLEKQKESLQSFLDAFSSNINEIYQFLNPDEKIENICLVPVVKGDELAGITIEFDFFQDKKVSPPHKYLSESHVNCLGIAFFLSASDAFNSKNKFLILDDVISSFDESHRKRFSDLLIERYSDYQIILLTHERGWFDIVKNLVKGKSWIVKEIKFSEDKGTYLDETPKALLDKILGKIAAKNEDGLANDSRQYLEMILKRISSELEVKVAFLFNDNNEDRMSFELLTALKSTLKKRKCTELLNDPVLERLLKSTFIANKGSHDGGFNPSFSDIKAFWVDVQQFEGLFVCGNCGTSVNKKYHDTVGSKISCKKGEISYSWS